MYNGKMMKLFFTSVAAIFLLVACRTVNNHAVSPSAAPTKTASPVHTPPSAKPAQSSAPPPTVAPTPADPIKARIAKMSDRELIGQMVMIGFTGASDMDSKSIQLLQDYAIGNVILFGWNTDTFSQTKHLTDKINAYNSSGIPLNISIDIEGGSVTRFTGQWKPFISSAQKLGQVNDPERVYQQYKRIGEQLREIGINVNMAPVLDIARDPSSTFLGSRMFGSDPDKVSALVRQAVKGLHDGGVASMGKHFPGHGDTASDSHNTLPIIDATLQEMRQYSLIPFGAAVEEGVDAMLVAHLSYPHVDSKYITSVSPTVITKILREELGFDGVVFSDDLRMQGLRSKYSVGEGAVLHILAGGDVVLIGKYYNLQSEVLESLYKAVQDGRITRARLEQSVYRILKMKLAYNDFAL
ncbi:MAG: glycoside hydrolase family 3 protein [Christensenellales bacterium]